MSRQIRTLVVDDSPAVVESIRRLVAGHPEMVLVGIATDGLDAVRKAQAITPDLIIMDIQMPKLDGIRASQAIRQACSPAVKIILTTSHSGEWEEAARSIPVSALVSKARLPMLLPSILVALFP